MLTRLVSGAVLAAIIAMAARRSRSLTIGGAIAAAAIGAIAVAAGWAWGAVLMVYFIASSALSHMGRAEKERVTAGIAGKGADRDAVQVLANGAVFAFAALMTCIRPDVRWAALGIGALAVSAADTWATELGVLYGGRPRSIVTWRRVPAGSSGGISLIGMLATVGGASFIGIVARIAGWDVPVTNAVVLGGIVGAVLDSILGATLQSRRWCEICHAETERGIHNCGTNTHPLRGFAWLDNDVVNFVTGALGGLLAAWLAG